MHLAWNSQLNGSVTYQRWQLPSINASLGSEFRWSGGSNRLLTIVQHKVTWMLKIPSLRLAR